MKTIKNVMSIFMLGIMMVGIVNSVSGQKKSGPNLDDYQIFDEEVMVEFCITFSCCGAGPFGIEIWTHEVCYEIENRNGREVKKLTFNLKPNRSSKQTEIIITEDIILPGNSTYDDKKLYIPKGTYSIVNDSFIVYPLPAQTRETCITQIVQGTFFGNDYEWEIEFCFSIDIRSNSDNGLVVLDLNLSPNQLAKLNASKKRQFHLSENTEVISNGLSYIFRAGNYNVNSDGKIYMPNAKLK